MANKSNDNAVMAMLKKWDTGSRNQRVAILSTFIRRHKGSTGAEIEKDLGNGALLFFTRITAWLRLTYQLGYELSVQLSALSLFLQSQKFMTNFMEVGGIQTLTDILCHINGPDAMDKNNTLLILIHIANSGRVYREMVCDGAGVDMLVKATLNERDERTLELISSLFLSLGQGNPRKASLVHSGLVYVMLRGGEPGALCAATTLRSLQLAKQFYTAPGGAGQLTMVGAENGSTDASDSLLDAFFHLLSMESVKLRFEGTELLSIAAQNHLLVAPIVIRCVEAMESETAMLELDNNKAAAITVLRQQAACARILANIILNSSSSAGGDVAEDLLLLLDRKAAHVTMTKFLQNPELRDIPTQKECLKAIAKLCLATRHRGGDVVTSVAQFYRERIGAELVQQLMNGVSSGDDVLPEAAAGADEGEKEMSDAFVVQVCQALAK